MDKPKNRCKIIVKWASPSLRLSEIEGLSRDMERHLRQNILTTTAAAGEKFSLIINISKNVVLLKWDRRSFASDKGRHDLIAAAPPQNISHFHQTAFQWIAKSTESVTGHDGRTGDEKVAVKLCFCSELRFSGFIWGIDLSPQCLSKSIHIFWLFELTW